MQLQRHSNSTLLTIDKSQQIGSGGEGSIYAVEHDGRLAAKIYHKPTLEHEQKLLAMFRNPPADPMLSLGHASIAWPVDLLRSTGEKNRIVGFLMPRVPDMFSVIDLFVPKSRLEKCPLFTYQYLHRAARNIAAAIAPLHARGYVIGDINESNILVSPSALVSLVDTDSFQVRDTGGAVFRCGVGKAEFTPPELQGKNLRDVDREVAHDLFGLAVLIFQLLMEGTHPFAGQYTGEGDPPSIVTRIQQGCFPHGSDPGDYAPPPIAPDIAILDPAIRELFMRCFEQGHLEAEKRPTASQWQQALDHAEARLRRCRKNSQHRYGSHLKRCPWCARGELLGGRDYYPSQKSVRNGTHLALLPTRQTPLPAVQTTAGTARGTVQQPHRKVRTQQSKVAAWIAPRWNDLAINHPTAHICVCTAMGASCLGAIRLSLMTTVSSMHGWMAPLSSLDHRSELNFSVAGLAVGAAVTAVVRRLLPGKQP